MDLDAVAAFLNTRDERGFGWHEGKTDEEREELHSTSDLRRWLQDRQLLAKKAPVSAADLDLALRLRASLRELLDPARGSSEPANRALSRLTAQLPLRVDFAGAGPTLVPAKGSAIERFASELLAACVTAAARGEWPRLKMCAATDCHWVFHDDSRNGLGRWCSMRVCGNRVKTRRYRTSRAG